MLNHGTLETEIKSFGPRAGSQFLFPELSLLCNRLFGELGSAETLHVAVVLSLSSKPPDSDGAFGNQPGITTARNHINV